MLAGAPVYGQEGGATRFEGTRLADALKDLEGRGLRIIYRSETVRPEMRITAEPRATALRRILDELLSPHGLLAREGPGGTLLIVKDPRARLKRIPTPEKALAAPPGAATAAAGDAAALSRFEETITVTDVGPGIAPTGPPPLAPRPLDVRGFAGGFENIFRTLQALPGVTATDELGSRISVRGGSPDQNLTVMDGIEIHNPYRLFVPSDDLGMVGLASTFNPETIDSVELFPGAFDVRHGDRLSSLLLVSNREGSDAEAFQGFAFLSLTDANVVLEGKLPDRADGSWLLTARRTYLDLLAERAIGVTLPSFEDLQARVSWHPRPRQRVALVGLAGRERTHTRESAASDEGRSMKTRNNLLAVTFDSGVGSRGSSRTIASFSRFTDALAAYERSFDNSRGANTADSIATGGLLGFRIARDVAVQDLAVRQEFVFKPSARHWLDLGFETHRLDTRWAWTISGDRSQHQANGSSIRLGTSLPSALDSSRDSYRFGAWVQDRVQVSPRLVLQPGLRVDRSSLIGQSTFSPRLSSTLNLGHTLRLDAALSLHAQSPGYEKLFQSDYFIDLSGGQPSTLKAERALHAVTGLQRNFGGRLSARVDAYYKRFSDLIVGTLETEEERQARLAGYDVPAALRTSVPTRAEITTSPLNAATGHAYGVDVLVSSAGGGSLTPLTGWAAYSFGRASRTAYEVTRPFDYDRRHAVSLAANLKIGSRLDLSATGRWATGFPRTPVRGVRLALVADADDEDGDGNREERVPQRDASGHPLFQPDRGDLSNVNAARLPHFARLDARLTYRPSWGGERWAFYADLINVLNAKNVIQIDSALVLDPASDRPGIIERSQDRGIPFFPSLGIRVWF
ncbi:MAG: TonB-dependent receptor plug [Acidobacteria bacterium]|nr:TonB-dependent receptor plug [Acidobacteriota bacterium]